MADTFTLSGGMTGTATISECGRYRYDLTRTWETSGTHVTRICFVMLNPSTADAAATDPTLSRCIRFAQAWGYQGLALVNLFAFRSPNPSDLARAEDPVGPLNDEAIKRWASQCHRVICAWGAGGGLRGRDREVMRFLHLIRPLCLRLTKGGHPQHPLYLPASCEPFDFVLPDFEMPEVAGA